jgi:hypothetical protein
MPYLAMIDRLRAFLRHATAVIVTCGFSFRDDHLNEVLVQGLRGTTTAIAFGLLYEDLKNYPTATALALERPNLTLLARDGGIIGGEQYTWHEKKPELVPAAAHDWISWSPVDPKNENSNRKAAFRLGDFAVFGRFLAALAGEVRT